MRWDEGLKTRSGSDPYLGRESVYHLDRMILVSLERSREIADWTHSNECSRLQRAASELIPHGLSLALGIHELVRSGYLFPAKVLARPLVERVAVISYLADVGEDAVRLWERGWPYKLRPSLATMLSHMRGTKNDDSKTLANTSSHFGFLGCGGVGWLGWGRLRRCSAGRARWRPSEGQGFQELGPGGEHNIGAQGLQVVEEAGSGSKRLAGVPPSA
jgi:hypothetical protein